MPADTDLERSLAEIEHRLFALGEALRLHRTDAVASESAELQRALAGAIDPLRRCARGGLLPLPLRQRLAMASGQVAAQRESLARAGAALDRAIDVLLPAATPRGAYSAAGISARPSRNRMVQA